MIYRVKLVVDALAVAYVKVDADGVEDACRKAIDRPPHDFGWEFAHRQAGSVPRPRDVVAYPGESVPQAVPHSGPDRG